MGSFPQSRDWSTYEGKPAGSDNINVGDDEIRATKIDIRQRMAEDHQWGVSVNVDGTHLQSQYLPAAADPTLIATYGAVYSKVVSANTELFYKDSAGNIVQLTSVGDIAGKLSFLGAIYPVGCIYTEVTGTNPNTTFGFGTWTQFAQGQVLVGQLAADSDFGTVLATGGEKTHKLTSGESGVPSHTHNLTGCNVGGPTNLVYLPPGTNNINGVTDASTAADASTAHNNLQPFCVVYFWRRTA